ncbi:hypothetical protein SAMN04488134_108125 [Amphibacillus marinus]|uniref:Uncharacterized protein n=1 Tax=Amphibacillus marinus TaxID=872970 RepID=A0A1H8QCY3_9BACI|nr:hypothetical protein [Amphibacillus marinus]SEO52089.1 hypothetical protein SAMN04488134_108125 [Amphibacillus marinus]
MANYDLNLSLEREGTGYLIKTGMKSLMERIAASLREEGIDAEVCKKIDKGSGA